MIPALEELRSRLQSLKDPYGNRAKSMSISDVIQMTFKIEQEYHSYYIGSEGIVCSVEKIVKLIQNNYRRRIKNN